MIEQAEIPQQPKLTQQQILEVLDEQTVFTLATMMMEVHTGSIMRQKNRVANAMLRVNLILRGNPGFPERFRAVQKDIINQLNAAQKPPTSTILKNE